MYCLCTLLYVMLSLLGDISYMNDKRLQCKLIKEPSLYSLQPIFFMNQLWYIKSYIQNVSKQLAKLIVTNNTSSLLLVGFTCSRFNICISVGQVTKVSMREVMRSRIWYSSVLNCCHLFSREPSSSPTCAQRWLRRDSGNPTTNSTQRTSSMTRESLLNPRPSCLSL